MKVASCIGRYRIEENRHVFREITSRTAIATDNWWDHWLQIGCVWRRSRENSNKNDFTEKWSCLTEEQAKRGLWNDTKQQEQDLKRRAESQICSNGASYQLIHWRAHQEVWCCCHQQLYLPLCQHQMVPSLQQELQEIQFRVKIDKKVGHLYSKVVLKSQTTIQTISIVVAQGRTAFLQTVAISSDCYWQRTRCHCSLIIHSPANMQAVMFSHCNVLLHCFLFLMYGSFLTDSYWKFQTSKQCSWNKGVPLSYQFWL